jgi:medium-chain acyl-[acyl-carrier-protein] hydrolase
MKNVNLYAFPYAFGGANIYRELEKYMDKYINIKSLNYPGHELRITEKFSNSIQEMAKDAYDKICEELDNNYCLLGYSMGGLVCYELYQIIKKNNKKLPMHMFIFASDAPDFKQDYEDEENMSLDQVRDILRDMDGTPDEILNNDELIEMITPIIRSDISNIKNYVPTNHTIEKVGCQVTVIRGIEEDAGTCHSDWNKYFANECEYLTVEGGHFFMFQNDYERTYEYANIINQRIRNYVNENVNE